MAISTIGTDALASAAVTSAKLASGAPSRSQLPAGTVLQVVQGTYATSTTTSAGPVDTGLSATITPTSSTSKVLILVNTMLYINGGGADNGALLSILRNGSSVFADSNQTFYVTSNSTFTEAVARNCLTYLDSPASTSALTYKTQMQATAGGSVQANFSNNTSTIVLMEIAA